jgi:DNA-binding CsgD family transcriptional regulator
MFTLSPDVRVHTARQALALPGLPEDLRGWLESVELHNLVVGGRTEEAQATGRAARASGSREARFACALATAGLDYQFQRFADALATLDAGRGSGTAEDVRARLAHYFRVWALAALDRFEEAFAVAEGGVWAARRDRQRWALYIFATSNGLLHLQAGKLPDAADALEGLLTVGDAATVGGIIDASNLSSLVQLRIHAADERGARDAMRMCERMLASTAPGVLRHAVWGLASHAMALGHPEQAHARLCTLGESERTSILPLFPHDIANDAELIRIALAVDDAELVARAVAAAEERERLNPQVNSLAACARQLRGLANRSTVELAAAVPLIRAARRPLALASTLQDLGQFLIDDGSTAEGVEALDEALGIAVMIGANRDAARIRSRLRRVGIHRRVVPAGEPRDGWESLTPAEHQIAMLVAEGCTNREISEQLFISPHTVNTHLRHIFDKLSIRSRVELALVAERRR